MLNSVGFKKFHPPQQEAFDLLSRDFGNMINVFNAVAGRGGGKTILAAAILLQACTVLNRGHMHAWTAPTYGMIDRFIIPTWRSCVPEFDAHGRRVWTYYKSSDNKRIEFSRAYGGATILLISREKYERIRGTPLAGIVHDEIGMDKTRDPWDVSMLCLRRVAGLQPPKLFCVGISTPRRGWWQKEVEKNAYVKWTSYDNPWAPKEQVAQMEESLNEKFARQELHADFISLTGAIWDGFVDSLEGNRVSGGRSGGDYILACDIGIHSGWLLIQERGDQDVIFAEYTPDGEGAQQTLKRIQAQYGSPYKVIVGSDVKTRWEGDANLTPLLPFRDAFGGIPVLSPTGFQRDKSIQYMVASSRIKNDEGKRRLVVAEDLISHDPDNARGCLDMFKNDEWPDVPRVGEQLHKDKVYEHIRDALLYCCVVQHSPSFVQGGLG